MDDRTKRIVRNLGIQGGSQLLTWSISVALLVILPRYLGDVGFGKLFFAISFSGIMGTLINLGINTYVVREVAVRNPWLNKEEGEKEFDQATAEDLRDFLGNVIGLECVLGAVVYGLMCGTICLLPYDDTTRAAVYLIGACTCFEQLTNTLGAIFQGLQSLLIPNIGLIVNKIVLTGGCAWLLLSGYDLIPVCWMHLAGYVVNFVILAIILLRKSRVQVVLKLRWEMVRRILAGGLPFLVWVIFGEIYLRVDALMLSLMSSDAVVGWYGAAFRLYGTLLFIPHAFNVAVFPAIARMAGREEEEQDFNIAIRRSLDLMVAVTLPVGVGAALIADPLLQLLYGPGAFNQAAPCLKVFGLCIVLVSVDVLLGSVLIAKGREKEWSYMAIVAAFVNPLLNISLIMGTETFYGNGGIGAAIATGITELVMMIGAFRLLPEGTLCKQNLYSFLKSATICALMVPLLRFADSDRLWWTVVTGALFYFACGYLIEVVPRAEVKAFIRGLIRSRG